jgi:uncharacterized protein
MVTALRLVRDDRKPYAKADVVTPALYRTVIGHSRFTPIRHAFRYRHPMWLVDLAHLPADALLGRLMRFEARDHLGDPGRSIRDNVVEWVGEQGLDVSGDRIVMLANARVLGYVFNPITVFWCLDRENAGALRCVIAEVHNTYGGRHCYLLRPDEHGRASVDKALYVSPFNPVDGSYDMRFTLPGRDVGVGVALHREGKLAFNATLTGRRAAITTATLLRTLAHYPLASLRVSALIRYQGIRLSLRGLPIVRRPASSPKGSS